MAEEYPFKLKLVEIGRYSIGNRGGLYGYMIHYSDLHHRGAGRWRMTNKVFSSLPKARKYVRQAHLHRPDKTECWLINDGKGVKVHDLVFSSAPLRLATRIINAQAAPRNCSYWDIRIERESYDTAMINMIKDNPTDVCWVVCNKEQTQFHPRDKGAGLATSITEAAMLTARQAYAIRDDYRSLGFMHLEANKLPVA